MNKERDNFSDYNEIDSLRWPAMPDPYDHGGNENGVWIFSEAKLRAFEQTNTNNAHSQNYLIFPYSLSFFDKKNRHLLTVALQQTDYRVLAELTQESVKTLRGSKKGHLSPVSIVLYDADGQTSYGIYEEKIDRLTVFTILIEIASDYFDLWEEPIRKEKY